MALLLWTFHRQARDDLQHVILHDIANRAQLLVEFAASLDAEMFGHRDLHVFNVIVIPTRLHDRIGKPKIDEVLNGLLPKVNLPN